MTNMPKLKVLNPSWDVPEEIRDFEQGKYFPFHSQTVVVEGEVVYSYEELVQLAAQEHHQGKESLEVEFIQMQQTM